MKPKSVKATVDYSYFQALDLGVRPGNPSESQAMLIPHLVPAGVAGLLLGESGVGKTQLALDMAVSTVLGVPFLGMEVDGPRPVVYLAMEGSAQSLRNRINRLVEQKASSPVGVEYDLVKSHLRVLNPLGPGFTNPEELLQAVHSFIREMDQQGAPPALVVLDTLACLSVGDESAAHSTRHLWSFAHEVASITNATVLVIHHFGKPTFHPGQPARSLLHSARGSSANTASARFTLSLTFKSKASRGKKAETAYAWFPADGLRDRGDVLELQLIQNNDGPDGFAVRLERDSETGMLGPLDDQPDRPDLQAIPERPKKMNKQEKLRKILSDPTLSDEVRENKALQLYSNSEDPKGALRSARRHLRKKP